jgi:hypothetical protein
MNSPSLTTAFKTSQTVLTQVFWDFGLEQFCQIAELDPTLPNSSQQFQEFQRCMRAMNQIPEPVWTRLLESATTLQPQIK